ncbi:hypothetical protein [Gracilibacillus halophilus]|nr:hypothetical protein [Gracilibacillus halophilus]
MFDKIEYSSGWISLSMDPLETYQSIPFGEVYDVDGNRLKDAVGNHQQ